MSAEGGRTGCTRLLSVESTVFFFVFFVLARIMYVECGGNRGPNRGSISMLIDLLLRSIIRNREPI